MNKQNRTFLKSLIFLRDLHPILLTPEGRVNREIVFKENKKIMDFLDAMSPLDYITLKRELNEEKK